MWLFYSPLYLIDDDFKEHYIIYHLSTSNSNEWFHISANLFASPVMLPWQLAKIYLGQSQTASFFMN